MSKLVKISVYSSGVFKIHIVVWDITPCHLVGRYWVMVSFIQVPGL